MLEAHQMNLETMERRAAGPEGLIRLSVGCENAEDLWSDLAQALEPG